MPVQHTKPSALNVKPQLKLHATPRNGKLLASKMLQMNSTDEQMTSYVATNIMNTQKLITTLLITAACNLHAGEFTDYLSDIIRQSDQDRITQEQECRLRDLERRQEEAERKAKRDQRDQETRWLLGL
jgi:hypothetical protein